MLSIAGGVLLGLLVGSFLNVVVYRLPVMLEREWRQQSRELLADGDVEPGSEPPFNLLTPRSLCPSCGTQIATLHNIPVFSWLMLGGKCATCQAPISARYPLIEVVTGLLSGLIVASFGVGFGCAAALLFLWALTALTVIDVDHQLLPDSITYPLLWLGLGVSLYSGGDPNLPFPEIHDSVAGAMAGYLSLWSVYQLFKLTTGKEGMGYGDFKLLAALGAWLGWQMLLPVILLSAVVGAAVGITMIVALGRDRQIPIPFGPYLAGAGVITLLWGERITTAYLEFTGL